MIDFNKTFIFCSHQADSVENQTKDLIIGLVELQKGFNVVVVASTGVLYQSESHGSEIERGSGNKSI